MVSFEPNYRCIYDFSCLNVEKNIGEKATVLRSIIVRQLLFVIATRKMCHACMATFDDR